MTPTDKQKKMMRTRREFLKQAGQGMTLCLASSFFGCAGQQRAFSSEASDRRPNILFIFSDDQRSDAMSCAGNSIIKTPEHDKLAAEGVLFENCFVTTSICCVSRASVLTGQYARRHGIDDFVKMFPDEQLDQTYPAIMRRSGYWTGFVGKWGVGANDLPNLDKASRVFDFWAGGSHQTNFWHERDCPFVTSDAVNDKTNNVCTCPPDYRGQEAYHVRIGRKGIKDPVQQTTEIVPMRMKQFLESRDKSKPFCMSISFKTPHGPWEDYPERFAEMYKDEKMPISPTATKEESDRQEKFLRKSLEGKNGAKLAADHKWLGDTLRNYYRSISAQDDAMGQIRKALTEAKVADNTIIVFTSDNGHFMGEHGFFGKWLMHEESIRVPCIIYDPRLPKAKRGKRREEMILNIDMAPTMLEMTGVSVPGSMQGRSLVPLVSGEKPAWRDKWFYEHVYEHAGVIEPCIGVRETDWKYIRYYKQEPVYEQLFDVRNDPEETNNLAGKPEHQEKLKELRAACLRYKKQLQ